MTDIEVPVEQNLVVEAPSGSVFVVLTQDEMRYFEEKASRYTTDNHFVNISDLQDVDRLCFMELMCYRYSLWLSQEHDYWAQGVDLDALKKTVVEYSKELRLLKKSLGIDKAQREKEKGENVADYLENLRVRAREFGVTREKQLTKALTLFNELKELVTLHNNCDAKERVEMNVEMEDIFEWIETVAIPEYDAIDEHFREHQQRFWIRQV
jgi:hypothetical protein